MTSEKKQKTPPEDKSPPQVAEIMGVKPAKVIELIRAGLLPAYDVRSPTSSRPRYRITPEALTIFRNRRAAGPKAKAPRRRRKDETTIEFFK